MMLKAQVSNIIYAISASHHGYSFDRLAVVYKPLSLSLLDEKPVLNLKVCLSCYLNLVSVAGLVLHIGAKWRRILDLLHLQNAFL